MANPAPITLQQLFRYYRGLPHQTAAIGQLEADLAANGYAVAMRRDRPWFQVWSQDGKQLDNQPSARPTNPLTGFPWFPQLDNGPDGWRQCQSSSIAMCLAYLGVDESIHPINAEFVERVGPYGVPAELASCS